MTEKVDQSEAKRSTWHPVYGNSVRAWLNAEAPDEHDEPRKVRAKLKRTLIRRR